MTLYFSLPAEPLSPAVVALGCFDGVHLGHRAVIEKAISVARARSLPCTVFTFDASPKNYFFPGAVPQLTDREQKIALLEEMGVDTLVCLPFDGVMANTSAEDFFHSVLLASLAAEHIVCGYNYSFGAGGIGSIALLSSLCGKSEIGLTVCEPITRDGAPISSSAIRQALEEGRISEANDRLGRPYSIRSLVVNGQHLGRRLGFPTLNQILSYQRLVPKYGVYLSRVRLGKVAYFGITNVGRRPTVGSDFVGAETHLFEFDGDLYGQTVEVELLSFLRPEQKFSSVDELSVQVHSDIANAKKMAERF